jgi:hypothetical protein
MSQVLVEVLVQLLVKKTPGETTRRASTPCAAAFAFNVADMAKIGLRSGAFES